MNADCYTNIGRQHSACQDYARTGTFIVEGMDLSELYDNIPALYAAVADGCSQAPDSDIGARLLVRGLENAILTEVPNRSLHAIEFAQDIAIHGSFDVACLDATLLYAIPTEDSIDVVIHGDGVVAARRRDGTVTHTVVECPRGAPDYLSYLLDDGRMAAYQSQIQDLKSYRSFEGDRMTSEMEVPAFYPVTLSYPRAEFDLVVLMSDGAQSFMRLTPTGTQKVPVHEVVEQVMAIKNTTGDFVVRRIRNGFLGRFCVNHNWHHYDDFAMAAIYDGASDG